MSTGRLVREGSSATSQEKSSRTSASVSATDSAWTRSRPVLPERGEPTYAVYTQTMAFGHRRATVGDHPTEDLPAPPGVGHRCDGEVGGEPPAHHAPRDGQVVRQTVADDHRRARPREVEVTRPGRGHAPDG